MQSEIPISIPQDTREWTFPTFIGHRRRLLPDSHLFVSGAMQHDATGLRDVPWQPAKETALASDAAPGMFLDGSDTHACSMCRASLPTAHLLDLHLAEVHDSFFAAQAARRLPVYACLVESCTSKFSTIEGRKQHLIDHHRFPKAYNFDRIHLRRRKGQVRPIVQGANHIANLTVVGKANGGKGGVTDNNCVDGDSAMLEAAEGLSQLSITLSEVPSPAFGRRRGGRAMVFGRGYSVMRGK